MIIPITWDAAVVLHRLTRVRPAAACSAPMVPAATAPAVTGASAGVLIRSALVITGASPTTLLPARVTSAAVRNS